jgi:hypothetical protein
MMDINISFTKDVRARWLNAEIVYDLTHVVAKCERGNRCSRAAA